MTIHPIMTFGHAFGTDFSLPLPLWLFIYAGIAAILLSFVSMALLYDSKTKATKIRVVHAPSAIFQQISKWLAVILLLLTIVTGYFGSQTASENFSVTFFWVIFLVGFTYIVAIFGNVWKVINPFKTIVELVERVIGKERRLILTYPRRLGYYPALASYFIVISLELVFDGFATTPRNTGLLVLLYLIITLIGSIVFGKKDWFRYADFFSVYFRLIAKLSPIVYTSSGMGIRTPFTGLLKINMKNVSLLLFVLFMLASTNFDGFTETKQYAQIKESLPDVITNMPYTYDLLVLSLALLLLYGLYATFMALTKLAVRTRYSVQDLCYAFAFSLLPIAVGYNIAHYLTYLLLTGQSIIGLISDPFGAGWDIFGTADYKASTAFLSAYTTWYIQVAAIIIGHVIAVYVAHRIAFSLFRSYRKATTSQLPLVGLMIVYTTASLWIIAQPVYIAQEKAKIERKQQQEFLQVLRQPPAPSSP